MSWLSRFFNLFRRRRPSVASAALKDAIHSGAPSYIVQHLADQSTPPGPRH